MSADNDEARPLKRPRTAEEPHLAIQETVRGAIIGSGNQNHNSEANTEPDAAPPPKRPEEQ